MTESPKTKTLLLAVTGESPAVLTETLYGIAQRILEEQAKRLDTEWKKRHKENPESVESVWKEGNKIRVDELVVDELWPSEIRIITSTVGEEKINDLIRGGWLRKVCEAVKRPVIDMADEHILVVPDADGNPVDDARSEEDHEALAGFYQRR